MLVVSSEAGWEGLIIRKPVESIAVKLRSSYSPGAFDQVRTNTHALLMEWQTWRPQKAVPSGVRVQIPGRAQCEMQHIGKPENGPTWPHMAVWLASLAEDQVPAGMERRRLSACAASAAWRLLAWYKVSKNAGLDQPLGTGIAETRELWSCLYQPSPCSPIHTDRATAI